MVHGELIPALARTHIQVGSPRQQIPVGCGARIQPRSPTVSGEQLMSATQQLDLAVFTAAPHPRRDLPRLRRRRLGRGGARPQG